MMIRELVEEYVNLKAFTAVGSVISVSPIEIKRWIEREFGLRLTVKDLHRIDRILREITLEYGGWMNVKRKRRKKYFIPVA